MRQPSDVNEYLILAVTLVVMWGMYLWSRHKSPSAQNEKALKADLAKEIYEFKSIIELQVAELKTSVKVSETEQRHFQTQIDNLERALSNKLVSMENKFSEKFNSLESLILKVIENK